MADLYVCPTCGETEDCACRDLATARRAARDADQEVRRSLGWLVMRLVQRMPDVCTACVDTPAAKRCPLCLAVARTKKTIDEVLPSSSVGRHKSVAGT